MATIVCVGLACLDYLFKVPSLPAEGGKYFADNYAAAPGGPAAVAALTIAALGHQSIFIGRLGDDQVGDDIIRLLRERNVETTHIRRVSEQPSQVSSVVIDNSGERQIINYSSRDLDPDPFWIPTDVIEKSDFLLTDVRWPEGAERAMRVARNQGIPSLLDGDIAPVDISGLVSQSTYAIFSQRGLASVSEKKDIGEALKDVSSLSDTWPAVTAGEEGSFWLEQGALRCCPARPITPVDTCGAGDVFHGAFAAATVEGMDHDQAMRFAGAAAALKCLRFGGSLGVPSRTEVDDLLARD